MITTYSSTNKAPNRFTDIAPQELWQDYALL